MDCSDFEKNVILYNEIPEAQQDALKLHLKSCKSCERLFRQTMQMERLVKEVASQKITSANTAKLTSRIMKEIHLQSSPGWLDHAIDLLQNTFIKKALATISTILLVTFSVEFFNDTPPAKYQNPITSGFAILNSTLFKEETVRQRSKTKFFTECISPFKPQQYLIDCAKSKLK
ncbi:MAG: hypothetical protein JST69_04555 [Bacteroidetes bacterium]|nr:hypothetical protein [Bacteroidota bacterium]